MAIQQIIEITSTHRMHHKDLNYSKTIYEIPLCCGRNPGPNVYTYIMCFA